MKKYIFNKTLLQLVLLAGLAAVVSVAAIELGLRFAGWLYYGGRPAVVIKTRDGRQAANRILCLGDSFTFGPGGSKGESYPDQLNWLIRESLPEAAYAVINAGVPDQNSSQLADGMDELIEVHRSSVVIVMTGFRDRESLADSRYYLFAPGWRGLWARMDAQLDALKVWKFAKSYFGKRDENHTPPAQPPVNLSIAPGFLRAMALGDTLAAGGKMDRALGAYRKAAMIYDADYRPYYEMGRLFQARNDYPAALEAYQQAWRRAPQVAELGLRLWSLYYRMDRPDEADRSLRRAAEVNPALRQRYAAVFRHGTPKFSDTPRFEALLEHNLQKILRTARSKHVELILMNYPRGGEWPGDIIPRFADRNKVICIDHAPVFERLSRSSRSGSKGYFDADGRCNYQGNRQMAGTVYGVLCAHGFVRGGGAGGAAAVSPEDVRALK